MTKVTIIFICCVCDHNEDEKKCTEFHREFTLLASATSAIFFSFAGFKVGNVFPEAESTKSLLMNNCNKQPSFMND
jgi:hypothetical protein